MKMPHRKTATAARAEKYGTASQLKHERDERYERDQLKMRMAKDKASAAAKGAKMARMKSREKGADSGTIGGSRKALMSAFFGKS